MPKHLLKNIMLNRFLFTRIDNSALVLFRIFFGLLLFLEAFGAILTGWVKKTLIEPKFTFTFIGFEWLQPLPGNWMYGYFAVMAICGLLVMIGYKYRYSLGAFTLLWTAVYLMQKSSYNNHYYLLILLCGLMLLVPAHRYASLDVKLNPKLKSLSMPRWCNHAFVLQMFIVYTYAAIAKLYPDWTSGIVTRNLMQSKKNLPIVGEFLQQEWIPWFLAYSGILFDGLIIPLLLWKPTRKIAFCCAIFFHLFNSFVLHIGIFPYMSLALCLFFFKPDDIRRIFFKKKPEYVEDEITIPPYKKLAVTLFSIYFIVQILLPLRHWTFKDDVLWTEEGHLLSWRMMLRSRHGNMRFKVVNKTTDKIIYEYPKTHLTKKQAKKVTSKPDMAWQFAQYLKRLYKEQGHDVAVYAIGKVRVNSHPYHTLIDPEVDLAQEEWSHFKHHTWILPSKFSEE